MCPLAQADGFYAFWLIDKLVPGIAAMIDDFGVGSYPSGDGHLFGVRLT
jgi:hypothetical protein